MNNWVTSFLLSAGVAAWAYSKMMRHSGNNTQNSLIAAAFGFAFGFIVMMTVLSIVDRLLS